MVIRNRTLDENVTGYPDTELKQELYPTREVRSSPPVGEKKFGSSHRPPSLVPQEKRVSWGDKERAVKTYTLYQKQPTTAAGIPIASYGDHCWTPGHFWRDFPKDKGVNSYVCGYSNVTVATCPHKEERLRRQMDKANLTRPPSTNNKSASGSSFEDSKRATGNTVFGDSNAGSL